MEYAVNTKYACNNYHIILKVHDLSLLHRWLIMENDKIVSRSPYRFQKIESAYDDAVKHIDEDLRVEAKKQSQEVPPEKGMSIGRHLD